MAVSHLDNCQCTKASSNVPPVISLECVPEVFIQQHFRCDPENKN
jgi:hypothetical protein